MSGRFGMAIVVAGATGSQGGAVVRALLAEGLSVRALVRAPRSPEALQLAGLGASLASGSFDDGPALARAIAGAEAVFSVQPAPFTDPDSERRQARALVEAARQAGARHFIHSSVSNAGDFRTMAGWAEGRWGRNYWESKADAEAIARDAGFEHVTILRPAFMMENFARPKAAAMFPDLPNGEIVTAIAAGTRIALIAASDIGATVGAALAEPARFAGEALELAGDWLTLPEVAEILSRVTQKPLTARTAEAEVLLRRGQAPGWVETQQWMNLVGYPARPAMMAGYGIAPTSFERWARDARAIIPAGG